MVFVKPSPSIKISRFGMCRVSRVTDMGSIFNQASSFNQDLFFSAAALDPNWCAWNNTVWDGVKVSNMFRFTDCPLGSTDDDATDDWWSHSFFFLDNRTVAGILSFLVSS